MEVPYGYQYNVGIVLPQICNLAPTEPPVSKSPSDTRETYSPGHTAHGHSSWPYKSVKTPKRRRRSPGPRVGSEFYSEELERGLFEDMQSMMENPFGDLEPKNDRKNTPKTNTPAAPEIPPELLIPYECPCTSNPCQNGGSCSEPDVGCIPADNCFFCTCTNNWVGETCSTPADNGWTCPCESSPCQNGGTCSQPDDGCHPDDECFECDCPYTHKGIYCETLIADEFIFHCPSAPCQNGGICTEPENGCHPDDTAPTDCYFCTVRSKIF